MSSPQACVVLNPVPRLLADPRWRDRLVWHGHWPNNRAAVAVVGTRGPTADQVARTAELAAALVAAGVTVVSGGARGVDSAALRAALRAGGQPIAVLPCHPAAPYPAENAELYAEIVAAGGGLLALHHPAARLGVFAMRNRLLADTVQGLIAVAADLPSGTLQATRCAVQAGAAVAVVPWPVGSARSAGTLWLAQHGVATIATAGELQQWLQFGVAAPDHGAVLGHNSGVAAAIGQLTGGRRRLPSARRPANTVDANAAPCPSYSGGAAPAAVPAQPGQWPQWAPSWQAAWQLLAASGSTGAAMETVVAATGGQVGTASMALLGLALAGQARQGSDGAWRLGQQ